MVGDRMTQRFVGDWLAGCGKGELVIRVTIGTIVHCAMLTGSPPLAALCWMRIPVDAWRTTPGERRVTEDWRATAEHGTDAVGLGVANPPFLCRLGHVVVRFALLASAHSRVWTRTAATGSPPSACCSLGGWASPDVKVKSPQRVVRSLREVSGVTWPESCSSSVVIDFTDFTVFIPPGG